MCYISLDQFASIHFGTRCDFLLFINCDRFLVVIVVYFTKWHDIYPTYIRLSDIVASQFILKTPSGRVCQRDIYLVGSLWESYSNTVTCSWNFLSIIFSMSLISTSLCWKMTLFLKFQIHSHSIVIIIWKWNSSRPFELIVFGDSTICCTS